MLRPVDGARAVRALETALAGRADVRVALLFGSTARDRATAQSDVDVAVLAPGVDLLALAADLGRAVVAEVDVVDLPSATIPLLSAIVRDGVRLHHATVGSEAAWRSVTLAMLETDGPGYERMSAAWLRRLAESRGG